MAVGQLAENAGSQPDLSCRHREYAAADHAWRDDTRVSPSQSYELYRSIKVRKPDVPVRLVLYPGEGHGNQKAAARYDYNLRMMDWFDTYLKTGNRKAAMPDPRPELAEGTTGTSSKDK